MVFRIVCGGVSEKKEEKEEMSRARRVTVSYVRHRRWCNQYY